MKCNALRRGPAHLIETQLLPFVRVQARRGDLSLRLGSGGGELLSGTSVFLPGPAASEEARPNGDASETVGCSIRAARSCLLQAISRLHAVGDGFNVEFCMVGLSSLSLHFRVFVFWGLAGVMVD